MRKSDDVQGLPDDVQGICAVNVIDDLIDKPCLQLKFANGIIVYITTNLAEMIGGIGAGVRKREEDKEK